MTSKQFPLWLALSLLAPLLVFLLYQRPATRHIDLGDGGDAPYLAGFSFAEGEAHNTFRWSGSQARIDFPGADQRDWVVRLRASAPRPSGAVTITVTADTNAALGSLTLGGKMAVYELPLARRFAASRLDTLLGLGQGVHLALQTPTFNAPPDKRELGIQVDWVEVQAQAQGC
jgi:hypothetical protein